VSTPTLPTDHDEYEALAVAWAVNALEPADQAIFKAHRDGCERCMRAAYAALDVATELAYGVPDVVPPARVRERVLAAAVPQTLPAQPSAAASRFESPPAVRPAPGDDAGRADGRPAARPAPGDDAGRSDGRPAARPAPGDEAGRSDGRPAAGPAPGDEARRRPKGAGPGRMARALRGRRRLLYALAAAVLVAGSAVTTWETTRPVPVADRIAALSAGNGTVATVVAHQHGADVVTDTLPPNAGRGTAYYVWGVPAKDGGTPQVVGTFEVTATGLHSYPLRLTRSLDSYPVLAISEEQAGSTPAAPSGVLGKGALGS
jgi:hypothetical protein